MTREEYRRAVDRVSFSPAFQAETVRLLADRLEHKEETKMKRTSRKVIVAAAAAVCLLAVGVSAAVGLLSPSQVAQRVGDPVLADAFASEDAVVLEDTRTVGDYNVTFMGLVSGAHLSKYDVDKESTYAVLAYCRADGTDIPKDAAPLTVTPLVEGYAPWAMNAWTLSGASSYFVQDGTFYCLVSCDTPRPENGGNVYLAVYPGEHTPPGAEIFSYDADTGAIAFQPGQEGALFPLPLN